MGVVTPTRVVEARYLRRRAADARVTARGSQVRAQRAMNAAQREAWRGARAGRVELTAAQRAAVRCHLDGELYGGSVRVWRELAGLGLVTLQIHIAPGRTRYGWGTAAEARLTSAGLAVLPLLDEWPGRVAAES